MKRPANFEIYEIDYTRPVEFQDILDLMVRLSGYTRRQPFTLEIRLMKNKVRYLLLSDQLDTPYLHKMLQVSNDIQFSKLHPKERKPSEKSWHVAIKRNHFSLKTDGVEKLHSFLFSTESSPKTAGRNLCTGCGRQVSFTKTAGSGFIAPQRHLVAMDFG